MFRHTAPFFVQEKLPEGSCGNFPEFILSFGHNSRMNIYLNKSRWLVLVANVSLLASNTLAWGPDGHRVVGALALDQLDEQARTELYRLMETEDRDELVEWCNWPDIDRATEDGAFRAPKHYVNMAQGASLYDRERDCPDGMCLTESIGEFRAEMIDPQLPRRTRKEAFAWVCHLLGDVHQPLHAGFGHDRGANDVAVQFNGEDIDLHWFWDGALIAERSESWTALYLQLKDRSGSLQAADWDNEKSAFWTNESHAFAEHFSYPDSPVISDEFADRSWVRTQDQLVKGGSRFAWVLNGALTEQNSDAEAEASKPGCHRKHSN